LKEKGLKRELGLLDIFSIASGAMISSGLFILPALAYAKTGPAVVFSYILAGILVLPAMLAKAELATAMPKAGGVYFFIERSMGAPAGTFGGLASWFSLSFKTAFALVGIGIFATLISPNITEVQIKLIAVGCCLFFMFVNIIGVKHTGRFQIALVLSLIGILVLYVFRGFLLIQPQRYTPLMPFGMGSVFATAGLVFISFGGLTKICSVAEEVKNPGRNIPLGMFLAFSIVMILYAAVVFTTVGLLDSPQLSSSPTPISLGASTFMGNWGSVVLAIAAFLAFISTANSGILSASRAPMAMSRDYLLPRFFGKINTRYKTPHVSIIFTTAFMIIVILFLSLEDLVKTASTLKILLFLLVNVSLIVMRESKIQSYRPKFRSPLYPWIQILGIVGYGFLIFEMGAIPLAITGGFVGLGAVWYWIYVRPNVKRQSALMHIVERVTAKELVTGSLEDELRDILIERDNIIEDRFDRLVKDCAILDAKGPLSLEEFFQKVAKELSLQVEIEPKRLFDLLMERERQSTTALHPGLAIPHIIIEGNHKFDLLLARCKEGVSFSASLPPVHTAFILVGTRDERNFHLRALTAIAQVTQEPGFEKSWLKARGPEELRNILLISTRKRIPGK
jgi:amino acid transporter/mannitol/fructose-specific phosphotransferase system IIA component (Ntr-type)